MKTWKKVFALVLALAMVIPGVYLGESAIQEVQAEKLAENGSYVALGYNEVENTDSIPTPKSSAYKGWLFAGWFNEETCTLSTAIDDKSAVNAGSYAKFVPADVLSVKAQSTLGKVTDEKNKDLDGKYVLRFISSVDSLDYSQVGFELRSSEDDYASAKYNRTNTVYQKIDSTTEGAEYDFDPKIMDAKSEYFITAKLGVADTDTTYRVRAFWVTLDGTTVYGRSRSVSVADGLAGAEYINVTFELGESVSVENLTIKDYSAEFEVDGTTVYAKVAVEKSTLKSATYLELQASGSPVARTVYRNLYTVYDGANGDKSWYDAYIEYAEKEGVEISEFVIATNADLFGLKPLVNTDKVNFTNNTIYLASDIDAGHYQWTPLGSSPTIYFGGIFDGQGYTSSGISINTTLKQVGIFGYVEANSKICDFILEDSAIIADNDTAVTNVGSVVGVLKGTVEDVYVASDVTITANANAVGGIVAHTAETSAVKNISNCWFAGNVTCTKSGVGVGGILGRSYEGDITIQDCMVTGTVTGQNSANCRAGGIVGTVSIAGTDSATTTIENSLVIGTIQADSGAPMGSAIGATTNVRSLASIANVYTTNSVLRGVGSVSGSTVSTSSVIVPEEQLKGENAVISTRLEFCTTDDSDKAWVATADGPELAKFSGKEAILNLPTGISTAWYYETTGNTYTIQTEDEFYGLAKLVNNGEDKFDSKTIKLDADLDLNPGWIPKIDASGNLINTPENGWTPIGNNDTTSGTNNQRFWGTFDGQGHTISGVYMNRSVRDAGLFGIVHTNAVLTNFILDNSYIRNSAAHNGAIVGSACGKEISNIYVTENVTVRGTSSPTGGFAGTCNRSGGVKFSNCWFAGNVFGNNQIGGIAGWLYNTGTHTIENCLVTGKLSGTDTGADGARVGGIVGNASSGSMSAKITNCLSIAEISAKSFSRVGNVVGCENPAVRGKITVTNVYTANTIAYTGSGTGDFSSADVIDGTDFDADTYKTIEGDVDVISALTEDGAWTKADQSYPIPTALYEMINKQ